MKNLFFDFLRTTILARQVGGAFLVVFLTSAQADAQIYSVDWFSIDGGGGTATGGPYSISGTIGQPDTGTMSGGPYTLVGGFWSVISVVQTPHAPLLTITQDTTSAMATVSWPLPGTGFVLQETPDLNTTPGSWATVPFPYQTNANDIFITVPSTGSGNRFFRLMKP